MLALQVEEAVEEEAASLDQEVVVVVADLPTYPKSKRVSLLGEPQHPPSTTQDKPT